MLDFLKRQQKSELDLLIDKLPLSPDMKLDVRGACNRQIADNYDADEHGDTLRQKDLQIITWAHQAAQGKYSKGDFQIESKANLPPIMGNTRVGYAPAGSILRKIYQNEYALQGFLSQAYWASYKARKELWVERDRDSYTLVAAESIPKRTIKQIDKILKDLNVNYIRNKIADNLSVFGDCVLQNSYNKWGGLIEINPLLMTKISERYDPFSDKILGWQYVSGPKNYFIPYDDADHLHTFNATSNYLGSPSCGTLVVDQEAALLGSIYNNNVMREGGLLSVVFRLKSPENASVINDRVNLNLADEFTKWLSRQFSGTRGSGKVAFVPMVDGIDVLNKIGEMDTAFTKGDEICARKTALCFGVPPERIGILNGSQYKNIQQVTDSLSLSFDNNNYYIQRIVDEYLTRIIIEKGLGIDNVKIESSGEYSSISLSASEFIKNIADCNTDILRVDEARSMILHIPPLGGELGNKFIGEVVREMEAKKTEADINRAVGAAKYFLPEYQEYHKVNKVRYRSKDCPFLD